MKQKGPNYYLKCKQNKQYLTVESAQNGAKFYLSPKTGQQNQQFRIDEA